MNEDCFIIMPFSDNDNYDAGHFNRVYDYLIKPAVEKAGFIPIRADDINQSNYIVLDIVKRLLDSAMVICDLSSKNPNVFYELGIRQSFNLPVTLLKDELTERIFDIQGFRYIEYNSNLRVDEVNKRIDEIADNITNTYSKNDGLNSLVNILGISTPQIDRKLVLSQETSLILKVLDDLNQKINHIESKTYKFPSFDIADTDLEMIKPEYDYRNFKIGDTVSHKKFGEGKIVAMEKIGNKSTVNVEFESAGPKHLMLRYANLMKIEE